MGQMEVGPRKAGRTSIFSPRRRERAWQRMEDDRLESSILEQRQSAGPNAGQFNGAIKKFPGEIRQLQDAIDFARELNQDVGAAAVQFRLVQVVGDLEDHGNLGRQGARPANIFARDASSIETVEYAEHAEHASVRCQQWDRQ